MKLSLCVRLATKELRNNFRFSTLFCLNLAIGMAGFLLLDTVKSSIESSIGNRSQVILGADLAISAYRPLTAQEQEAVAFLRAETQKAANEISFMSMAASPKATRLAEIRAIERSFPLYGEILFASNRNSTTNPMTAGKAWVSPEILIQLELNLGDRISIGQKQYEIAEVIADDPSSSTVSFAVAPRIYVSIEDIDQAGLIDKGSRISYSQLIQIKNQDQLSTLETRLKEALRTDQGIRIKSHTSANEQMSRFLKYLNDYLGLIALVALFLSAIGGVYLFKSYIMRKTKDIAILQAIGASPGDTRKVYVTQLMMLGFIAAAMTIAVCMAIMPFLKESITPFLSKKVAVDFSTTSAFVAFVTASFGSLLFCLPHIMRLGSTKPSLLFQEAASEQLQGSNSEGGLRQYVWYLPAAIAAWGLAVAQSQSLRVGSLFVGGFLASAALLAVACMIFVRLLAVPLDSPSPVGRLGGWWRSLALRQFTRNRSSTLASFVAVGLGCLLISIIPQLRSVVTSELESPDNNSQPDLFLFDIQDEQLESLRQQLKNDGNTLLQFSPLIRARLEKINGSAPSESFNSTPGTREREQEERFRARMFNLSVRQEISTSETLVAGKSFSGKFDWNADKPAEISVESRFAERLGLKLNDILSFDVAGVAVEAKIVAIRNVRWASFLPNFFIQFQEGVFEDTPKTWVGALKVKPNQSSSATQLSLVKQFPNVSVIDVRNSIERILDIVEKITQAVNLMAILTLVAGTAVLYSISNHQSIRRQRDVAMLKVFGADFGAIKKMALFEFFLLGIATSTLGSLLGLIGSYGIAYFVFNADLSTWHPDPIVPLALIGFNTALVLVVGSIAVAKSLRQMPVDLLRNS